MFDLIQLEWSDFKDLLTTKGLLNQIQYLENDETYTIFSYDFPIKFSCTIWKNNVPDGLVASYSQSQNDADKSDFETNYKSDANQRLASSVDVRFEDMTVTDGYTTTTSTGFSAIRATTYTEQSSNAQRSLVSTDTNDTSAGTGARTVKITYYDEDLAGPFTETVTLNGTTAVNTTATDICFIERMDVETVGSQLGNVGTISLMSTTGGGGSAVGSIAPGDNETNWVHHYIAAGKALRILSIYAHIRGVCGGTAHLRYATPTVSNTPEKTVAPVLRVSPGTQAHLELPMPLTLLGPGRAVLYARPDASASHDWLAGFNYFEENT